MAGRRLGVPNKDKPFRDALRMQIAAAGGDRKILRDIADVLLASAKEGKMDAIKEVADRIDGKVPTPIAGADDEAPIKHALEISWKSVGDESSSTTSPDNSSSHSTIAQNVGLALSLTDEPGKP